MRAGISEMHAVLGRHHSQIEQLTENKELCKTIKDNGLEMVYVDNEKSAHDMLEELLMEFTDRPDYIILTHSLPYLLGSIGKIRCIEGVPMICISGLPCCIMHKGLEMAVAMIENGRYERILVIGIDKCYENFERIFFGTAMSDSAIGLMIEKDTTRHEVISSTINTMIIASNGVYSDADSIASFRAANPAFVRTAIYNCLENADLNLQQLDFIVCHTSNTKIWDQVSTLAKIPRSKFLDENIRNTGHMNSNDSFYHYFDYVHRGIIRKGQKAMLVNPGFGGSQGCTLLIC